MSDSQPEDVIPAFASCSLIKAGCRYLQFFGRKRNLNCGNGFDRYSGDGAATISAAVFDQAVRWICGRPIRSQEQEWTSLQMRLGREVQLSARIAGREVRGEALGVC
jgi:hypothetical protein